jgi:D-alanyl-D-alanine carboxypeptidase (penicillin-binding protein 5/6)
MQEPEKIEDDDAAYEKRREERRARHKAQWEREARKKQARKDGLRHIGQLIAGLAVVTLVICIVAVTQTAQRKKQLASDQREAEEALTAGQLLEETELEESNIIESDTPDSGGEETVAAMGLGVTGTSPVLSAETTADTQGFWDEIVSTNGVLIDVEQGTILADRGAFERINPASMTKILTVLVAAEHVTDLDDTFTMTIDITDYSYVNDCSNVGYEVGEVMTVRDLFYGTVLPSGGDAAVALATYVAGSHEAFVELMNEKLEALGLSETTHFTNCVGIYDEAHYSTAYDMAVILKAAVDNPWCREVLSTHTYTTSPSVEHPDGIILSNWFLRRIEDKDTHSLVECAKTGYVTQSGNCAASFAVDGNGETYLCVTVGASSVWRCIYDQTDLYSHFLPEIS